MNYLKDLVLKSRQDEGLRSWLEQEYSKNICAKISAESPQEIRTNDLEGIIGINDLIEEKD